MLTKEVLPYIRKSDRGTIIYISSIAGLQPFSVSIFKFYFKLMQ